MKIFNDRIALKDTKRQKRYMKYLTYSLTDPLSRLFRDTLIFLHKKLGYVYLLLMFFTSGITTVLTKSLFRGNLNAYHVLTYTSFIGLLILVIFNYKKGLSRLVKSKLGFGRLIAASVLGFSLYELTFNIALQYMTVSQTIIIYYSNPIFLYFAGLIFLKKGKEKAINIKVLTGILLSFAGVYFVLTGGKLLLLSFNKGIIYIFIAIISITAFTIMAKKRDIPELQFLFVGQAISFISGIFILTVKSWWIIPNFHESAYIIFIAVVYNLINMVFYLKTLQFLSVEKLSTLTYASPIVTSGLAVLILKEPLLITTVIGLSFVIIGNIIASYKNS